jgi:hypothetical protein
MVGDRVASWKCQQQHNTSYLTTTLSAAGRSLPPLCSVTSCFLELYHQCMDSGGLGKGAVWCATVLLLQNLPDAPVTVPPQPSSHQPGSLAGERRWPSRRWPNRRRRSQDRKEEGGIGWEELYKLTATLEEGPVMAAVTPNAVAPAATKETTAGPTHATHHRSAIYTSAAAASTAPRKHAEIFSGATCASCRAAVQANKRQIPQIDGMPSGPIHLLSCSLLFHLHSSWGALSWYHHLTDTPLYWNSTHPAKKLQLIRTMSNAICASRWGIATLLSTKKNECNAWMENEYCLNASYQCPVYLYSCILIWKKQFKDKQSLTPYWPIWRGVSFCIDSLCEW